MAASNEFESKVLAELGIQLAQVCRQLSAHGKKPEILGDPRSIAARMMNSIPKSSPTNSEIGPSYTTASLTKWLCVTRQYIYELTKQKRILSFTSADGHLLYPEFQFGLRGAYLPGLSKVIAVLEPFLDPRSIILWFVTPQPDLKALSPAAWLKLGKDVSQVIWVAESYMSYYDSELVGAGDGG